MEDPVLTEEASFFGTQLPADYRAWNELLIDGLFPRGRAGVPVYLAVHDGLLDDLGSRAGLGGRAEFLSAVRALCPPSRLFVILRQLAEAWADTGSECQPPFVAGLALAVLAAGEMETDANATQANYYVRLNVLLQIPARDRPEGFEYTLELWSLLQAWLHHERRGELVVRGADGARRFVDPVKSQCLIRSCDVGAMLPILGEVATVPGEPLEPEDLLPALRAWLLSVGARSRLALLLGRSPDDATLQLAAEALCDAIEDYSAEAPSEVMAARARPSSRASLALRPNRYPNLKWRRAEWLLRLMASTDASEPECLVAVGDRVAIAQLDVREPAAYDASVTASEAALIFRNRLRVSDEDDNDITPRMNAAAWFQDGAVRGRPGTWDLVPVPTAEVSHAVVVTERGPAAEIVSAAAGTAVLVDGSAEAWPGDSLFAACEVVPGAGATFCGNIRIPARPLRLRVRGGLPIRRRVYLRGALPSIVAPGTAVVTVESKDRHEGVCVTTSDELRGLDLPEGGYLLRCENAVAEIFVIEPRWRECLAPNDARIDADVGASLSDATVRGPLVLIRRPLYATHFSPGTRYRIYAPKMLKGVAPVDCGVHEVLTSEKPRQIAIIARARPAVPDTVPRASCFEEDPESPAATYSERQYSAVERLLEYVSARGRGSIEALRASCASIVGESAPWHSILSTLEDLGHLEVSWQYNQWAVTPPTIIGRAVDDGLAVLVGVRTRDTVSWLKERGISLPIEGRTRSRGRTIMPACIHLPAEVAAMPELREIGVRVVPESPAYPLAVHARPITETDWWVGPHFTPSSRIRQTLERWHPHDLRWTRFDARPDGPALYRWREHGVVIHYIVDGALRARVRDPSAAKWALAPREHCYLVYEAQARRLLVPLAIGLPRLYRRICTIASGLAPVRSARVLLYEDIPIGLARALAVRLNQRRGEGF